MSILLDIALRRATVMHMKYEHSATLTEAINLRVAPETYRALAILAAKQKRTVSFIAREMIEAALKKAGKL